MLSTLYILAVVLLTAVPCHFYLGAVTSADQFFDFSKFHFWICFWLVAGLLGSLALGAIATAVPLAIGLRAFRRLEF